jgi:hypothetical protein
VTATGRSFWWPKDGLWWDREHVVELGLEFGPGGPAVLDWLSCHAKLQNDGGWVKAGFQACGRGCFVDAVTVRHVVSRAVALGALDDFTGDDRKFTCRISGWKADNDRARAAVRQQERRDRVKAAKNAVEPTAPDGPREPGVTRHAPSRPVTDGHADSHTGQDRREEELPQTPTSGGIPVFPSSPAAPKTKRRRDQERHEAATVEHRQFVAEHFPDEHPDAVLNTALMLRRRRVEPTVDRIRASLQEATR